MKCTAIILVIFLLPMAGYNQTPKGMSVPKVSESKIDGKTYALIVGVSKYKNPAIPQLEYADKDAMAFRNYLVASGVDSNNITLLLNEKATNGEFWASINFLTDVAKKGDRVFIYFSGHGDVENKTVVKDAYLLPYDAPKCVYPACAIGVLYLKSWIATLSANGIQAIFIADACRSGNLAGGREGMEAAAAMLKDKWQDEIKILSCQPGELSLEGKQWGGGRGLFSYELINGLAGLADKNKDGKVTLRELSLYMMEKVPDGAAPMQQNPALFGSPEAVLTIVTPATQKEIIKTDVRMLASVDVKGFEETLLAGLNDSVKYCYKMFKAALDTGNYFDVNRKIIREKQEVVIIPSAYYYFSMIPDNNQTHVLVSLMKRNLCSAILEDIDTNIADLHLFQDVSPKKFGKMHYAMPYLRTMMGTNRLNELGILPKVLTVEVIVPDIVKQMPAMQQRIAKMDTAIAIAPGAGYLYLLRGALYGMYNFKEKALPDIQKCIQLSPKLSYGYAQLTAYYYERQEYTSAAAVLHSFIKANSETKDSWVFQVLAQLNAKRKMFDSANYCIVKALAYATAPDKAECFKEVAIAYGYMGKKDFAHEYINKYINEPDFRQSDSSKMANNFLGLAKVYAVLDEKENATRNLALSFMYGFTYYRYILENEDMRSLWGTHQLDSIMAAYFPREYDSSTANYFVQRARDYRDYFKNYDETERCYKKAIGMEPKNGSLYVRYAKLFCLRNDQKAALSEFEKGLQNGYKGEFNSDPAFDEIRSTAEFKALMKKYFPDDYKE